MSSICGVALADRDEFISSPFKAEHQQSQRNLRKSWRSPACHNTILASLAMACAAYGRHQDAMHVRRCRTSYAIATFRATHRHRHPQTAKNVNSKYNNKQQNKLLLHNK